MASMQANRGRLDPGDTSIDRVIPSWNEERQAWRISWTVRLKDGRTLRRTTQGSTRTQARVRARAKAQELIATGGASGAWNTTSSLGDYIAQVSLPAIKRSATNPSTLERHLLSLKQLQGECPSHTHERSIARLNIASGMRFRAIEAGLQEIAALHGEASARSARSVLSKYVIQQLIRDDLLGASPLAGMAIDIKTGAKAKTTSRGRGIAVTRPEYFQVIEYLMAIDVADVDPPQRGRWTLEDRIAKRRNLVDLALLQASTGLRQNEATRITWDDVHVSAEGHVLIYVPGEVAKNGTARIDPILLPAVAERLLTRREADGDMLPGNYPLVGMPTDPAKVWKRDQANTSSKALYEEVSEALDIPLMRTDAGKSHMWRTTLNTLFLVQGVPEEIRARHFGHTVAVNRQYYVDHSDPMPLLTAMASISAEAAESSAEGQHAA